MKYYSYTFCGAKEYDVNVFPLLDAIFMETLADPEGHYFIAVDEAVTNALHYGKQGADAEKVVVEVRLTESDITTVVLSDSRPFDVLLFRDKMRRIAENPQLAEMPWGEYTSCTQRSRGYWLMLQACEYLYLDVSGKRVSLVQRIPCLSDYVSRDKIKHLVPRFFVEKGGVIV